MHGNFQSVVEKFTATNCTQTEIYPKNYADIYTSYTQTDTWKYTDINKRCWSCCFSSSSSSSYLHSFIFCYCFSFRLFITLRDLRNHAFWCRGWVCQRWVDDVMSPLHSKARPASFINSSWMATSVLHRLILAQFCQEFNGMMPQPLPIYSKSLMTTDQTSFLTDRGNKNVFSSPHLRFHLPANITFKMCSLLGMCGNDFLFRFTFGSV